MTLLLVDANNVAMRAVHAMARSGLTSDEGIATGPLLNFITTLSRHIKDEKPRAVAVCWDGGRSEDRLAISAEYKAHRADMPGEMESFKRDVFGLAKQFCTLAGIHHVERRGFEADDLIAYYWRRRNPGEKAVIVSSDKDFLQLVDTNTEQVRLSSSNTPTDRWNYERVIEDMGVRPSLLPFAMALAGDVSDNVIGVPRVGMKTAAKIVKKYEEQGGVGDDWFEEMLRDPKVAEHADTVRKNLMLVDLTGVAGLSGSLQLPAVPSWRPTLPGQVSAEALVTFLQKYQMNSILSRFAAGNLWN